MKRRDFLKTIITVLSAIPLVHIPVVQQKVAEIKTEKTLDDVAPCSPDTFISGPELFATFDKMDRAVFYYNEDVRQRFTTHKIQYNNMRIAQGKELSPYRFKDYLVDIGLSDSEIRYGLMVIGDRYWDFYDI